MGFKINEIFFAVFFFQIQGYLLFAIGINHRTRIIKEPVLIIKSKSNENFICEQPNPKF